MQTPKSFYIRTYGCQMNELDTEIMAGQLAARGLTQVFDEESADILLFNTCSIRDLAERKVMGKLGLLAASPKKDAIIGVTGCMANAKKEAIFQKIPHVDFILGTNNIHHLNEVLDDLLSTGKQQIRVDDSFTFELDYHIAKRESSVLAHVSIIRGCNKFCTYCVVPYTRGPEVSRPPENILDECRMLAQKGYKEITLLGQNVNSYGKDRPEWKTLFHDLLYDIDKIEGIERVRFMTSHPVDITYELMTAIRDLPSLCEFIHFPMQAASPRILRKMHRIYTIEEYLEKVAMIRSLIPNAVLGTDIIVGFPSETEEDFQMTYDRMKELEFDHAFIFTYSARKGTPALRFKDDVPDEVKNDRHARLLSLHREISFKKKSALIGTEVEVLVEKRGYKDPSSLKGRTRGWFNTIFKGDDSLIGTLQKVKIHSLSHDTLIGERVIP